MIRSFADKTTEDIYNGVDSKDARRIPKAVWPVARRKMDMLNAATRVGDLAAPPGNRLERLRGKLAGRYSIRVNDQYRLVFRFEGSDAEDVLLTDYH